MSGSPEILWPVATVAFVVALGLVDVNSDDGTAVGGFGVALAACAAIHAFVLFWPGRARPSLTEAAWPLVRSVIRTEPRRNNCLVPRPPGRRIQGRICHAG
jgi:hypothetical protein